MKLKEANLALNTQNIRNKDTDFGRDAKNILASSLANGVNEKDIIDNLSKFEKTIEIPDSVLSHSFACPNAVMIDPMGNRYGNAYIPSPCSATISSE